MSDAVELIVIGELNVDLILEDINQLPEIGKERVSRGMALTLGSSSAIMAANASALGLKVGFAGGIGADAFGAYVLECLNRRRVDTSRVREIVGEATGLTAIYTYGGDRGAITYPGAMEQYAVADIPWPYVEEARHLHLSSYYLQKGVRPDCARLFREAKEAGLSTSLDTNWDPDERWDSDLFDVLPFVDVFLPNDHEARLISGEADLEKAMQVLATHVEMVVVKCGAEGARAQFGDRRISCPPFAVKVKDAVGAGDSFNAGFLLGYVRGRTPETCLQWGCATGAYSTTAAGGIEAFDHMDQFSAFVHDAMREDGQELIAEVREARTATF